MYEDKSLRTVKGVVFTEMDGEVVLMNVAQGEYYSLNETGSLIWNRMDETGVSFDDLCRAVLDEFDVAEDVCRRDTAALLDYMIESGVVEIVL